MVKLIWEENIMKTKKFFAGIIAVLVAVSLTTLNVSAAVQDVTIKPNSSGEVYIFEDEFYFLDIYSSETKLIDADGLEGALAISVRLNVTNAENYDEDIDVTLDIEVDENGGSPSYFDFITLEGNGEYTVSTELDEEFEVNPDTLGIFLSLDFWGDIPTEDQVPNIEVLEIIVKKDVADSGNTGDTGNTGSDASNSPQTGDTIPLTLLAAIMIMSGLALCAMVKKAKQEAKVK